MAGINHERVVASRDKGLAEDWNKDHKQKGHHDCEQFQHLNHVIENRTDWPAGPVEGQVIYRTDLNLLLIYNGTAWENVSPNPPIGSITAWLKTFPNTPALPYGWVECNGQVLADADSVYNGETIPDLNGENRFLRGNAASGGTGGSETHTHTLKTSPNHGFVAGIWNIVYDDVITGATDTKPSYYEVVWIMRIK